MSYTPGITLRPWTVGGTTTTEAGEPLFTRAKITASRSLMLWGATGWRYESATKTITSTEGAQLSAESPVCDQSGWRTEGNAIIDVSVPNSYTHTYTIKVSQFRMDASNREIPVGTERTYANVYIPTGDLSPFDLDLMLPAPTVAGGVVLVPDTWDAKIVAAEAAAERAANRQTTPLPEAVPNPEGFTWTTHPLTGKLFVDQHGIFTTTLDPRTLKHVGGVTYYVDLAAGNDANDGLTDGTALQRLYTALQKADVGTVMLKGYANNATPYYRARGSSGFLFAKSVNIIGYGTGMPCVTTHDLLAWTLTAGKSSTYQAARTGVMRVMDMVNGASGVELLAVGSIDAVEATVGSWYTDGTTVYVRPSTARAADSHIWGLLNTVNIELDGDFTLYIEGVKFYGGSECVRVDGATAAGALLVMYDCEVHASTSASNNVAVNDGDAVIVAVKSTKASSDGFGYHLGTAGHAPKVVEVGCHSVDNGTSSDDQCSTMHDGGKIIRVNGVYARSTGANVADVNAGTESWNLGCVLEDSRSGYNFKAGNDTGNIKMWLDGCSTQGARWSLWKTDEAAVKARATRLDRTYGTVLPY